MRVYAITPESLDSPGEYSRVVGAGIRGGITAVQYRDKRLDDVELRRARARAVGEACRAQGVLFVVNDDPFFAIDVGADGVHLGPEDMTVLQARKIVHDDLVIGASAGTVERARQLVFEGADYLGVGAIFDARESKPNASAPRGVDVLYDIRDERALVDIPIVAIGGITAENAAECVLAGADGVAAIRGLLGADDPGRSASTLAAVLSRIPSRRLS
jgi:thiamine-phosphate pyrophosphorylase